MEGFSMKATSRELIGRTIVGVNFRCFVSRPSVGLRADATNPVLTLDDGSELYFVVQETESGEYGVCVCVKQGVSNFNNDSEWMRQKAEAEDGCSVSVGSDSK